MFSMGWIRMLEKNKTPRNISLSMPPFLFVISITSSMLLSPIFPPALFIFISTSTFVFLYCFGHLFSFPWALALCQVLYTLPVHIFLHLQWQIPCTLAPSRIILLFQFFSSVFSCFSRLFFVSYVYFFLLTLCCYALRKWHRRALFSANL